jgi:hypothetical protein
VKDFLKQDAHNSISIPEQLVFGRKWKGRQTGSVARSKQISYKQTNSNGIASVIGASCMQSIKQPSNLKVTALLPYNIINIQPQLTNHSHIEHVEAI